MICREYLVSAFFLGRLFIHSEFPVINTYYGFFLSDNELLR